MNVAMITAGLVLLCGVVLFGATVANQRKVVEGAVNLAWLGLALCMGAIYMGELPGFSGALSVAALASMVTLPAHVRQRWVWTSGVCFGAVIPVALALGGVALASRGVVGATPDNLLLLAGQWATLASAITAALSAVGLSAWRHREHKGHLYVAVAARGVMFVIAAACMSLALAGWLRSDVPTSDWSMPLHMVEGGRAMWGLPESLGGPKTFGLRVAMPVDEGVPLLIAIALLALGASLMHYELRPKLARQRTAGAWALTLVATLITVGVVLYHGARPELPDAAPYMAWATGAARARGLPDHILAQATFAATPAALKVRWASLAPEAFLITMLVGLIGVTTWLVARCHMHPLRGFDLDESVARADAPVKRLLPTDGAHLGSLHARDMLARASALLWVSWTLGNLVTWRLHGAYGLASPVEWVTLGLTLAVTGLTVLTWSGSSRAQLELRRTTPALVVSLILLGLTCTFASGVTFGVPFRF